MKRSSQKGQTSIEYILILVVVAALVMTFGAKIRDWFVAGTQNCTASSTSALCKIVNTTKPASFRYFPLYR